MFLTANRPDQARYVEFREGQFVSFHQTKASSRLATQEEKQRVENDPLLRSDETTSSPPTDTPTVFEGRVPIAWHKGIGLLFLVFLFLMGIITFQLSKTFLSETQAFLSTQNVPLIEEVESWLSPLRPSTSGGQVSNTAQSKELIMTDLTQILHIHHAINGGYESVKTVARDYASAKITAGERNNRLTKILDETTQLLTYNESRWEVRKKTDGEPLYKANHERLLQLQHTVHRLAEAPYRGLSLDYLNEEILNDQPLFQTQIATFKTVLSAYEIPFTETNGKLVFSFEDITPTPKNY